MPKLVSRLPKYRRHKASGQALVTINGKDFYLGRWKSAASKAEYSRLIGEYLAHGRVAEEIPDEITVSEIFLAYVRWGKVYYAGSKELAYVKLAMRPAKEMYARSQTNTRRSPISIAIGEWPIVEENLIGSAEAEACARAVV